jgi:hypothetical protein
MNFLSRQLSAEHEFELKALERLLDFVEPWAQRVLPPESWTNVTDDALLGMIKQQRQGGDESIKTIAAQIQQSSGAEESDRPILEILVQTAAVQEFDRRKQQRQTTDGKLLLEFVVQRSPESLRRLMPALTRRLYFHPLLPTLQEAKEEIAAEAGVALEERLYRIRNARDPLHERMAATLDGRMNQIPDKVRQKVLAHLNTAARRVGVNQPLPENPIEKPVTPSTATPYPMQELVIQEYLQSLLPKDLTIVQMLVEGYTQDEIARALGVTPSAICQRTKRIRNSLPELF